MKDMQILLQLSRRTFAAWCETNSETTLRMLEHTSAHESHEHVLPGTNHSEIQR